jgi:hypothetical protein
MESMPAKQPYVDSSLTEADVIIMADCGQCWPGAGQPCDPAVPGGWVRVGEQCFHPLRLRRAENRAGLLLAAVRGTVQ